MPPLPPSSSFSRARRKSSGDGKKFAAASPLMTQHFTPEPASDTIRNSWCESNSATLTSVPPLSSESKSAKLDATDSSSNTKTASAMEETSNTPSRPRATESESDIAALRTRVGNVTMVCGASLSSSEPSSVCSADGVGGAPSTQTRRVSIQNHVRHEQKREVNGTGHR